jgi:hypothetical protein
MTDIIPQTETLTSLQSWDQQQQLKLSMDQAVKIAVWHDARSRAAISAAGWRRFDFCSVWEGPDLTLVVIQENHEGEDWRWACRGWREPETAWSESFTTREKAESAALEFYLQED